MYFILSDELRNLLEEVQPWIVGRKSGEENFAPIFKEDTPPEIFRKYLRFKEIAKKEFEEHTDEREYQ